jgi:hypothetical protein
MLYNAVWSLGVALYGPEKTPSEPDQDNRLERDGRGRSRRDSPHRADMPA